MPLAVPCPSTSNCKSRLISCPWISSFVTVEIQLGARPHSIISTMLSLKPWDYLSSGYQKWSHKALTVQ
jgi:hypothetical protein